MKKRAYSAHDFQTDADPPLSGRALKSPPLLTHNDAVGPHSVISWSGHVIRK